MKNRLSAIILLFLSPTYIVCMQLDKKAKRAFKVNQRRQQALAALAQLAAKNAQKDQEIARLEAEIDKLRAQSAQSSSK